MSGKSWDSTESRWTGRKMRGPGLRLPNKSSERMLGSRGSGGRMRHSNDLHATGEMFSSFEAEQLTTEERLYLHAAKLGDYDVLRDIIAAATGQEPLDPITPARNLGDCDPFKPGGVNINCVDYMGRNALHLSVDSENVDCIELLLDNISSECYHEALLHATSKGLVNIVRIILDHPRHAIIPPEGDTQITVPLPNTHFGLINKNSNGTAVVTPPSNKDNGLPTTSVVFRESSTGSGSYGVSTCSSSGYTDSLRTHQVADTETYQYSPDITPLVLAAHRNDHEMIQLFLSRGHKIDRPHAIYCQCNDCQIRQSTDSLKRSLSRLNAYKALSSPAFMALATPDPITTTFELRQEMMKVAQYEKEFKTEYLACVQQCMHFANDLMDLCRGTKEMEAVLGADCEGGTRDPLARLRLAIKYNEKKFVAHPNCQQHLAGLWFGVEMSFLQSLSSVKKIAFSIAIIPILPFLCLIYIALPDCSIGRKMRCPVSKFVVHTISHFFFLTLLVLATLHSAVGENAPWWKHSTDPEEIRIRTRIHNVLRSSTPSFSKLQILLLFWIIGLLWTECKKVWSSGLRAHFTQYYNYMDFFMVSFYLASYTLRFITHYYVTKADRHFNAMDRALDSLRRNDTAAFDRLLSDIRDPANKTHAYFINPSRFSWEPDDPLIISEILFSAANVLSFARTTYVMPSHEKFGPLQISLQRMIGDVARFVTLFLLVLFAFMVGMTNLYQRYEILEAETSRSSSATEAFNGLHQTIHTLFFSIFGLITLDKLKIKITNTTEADTFFTKVESSTEAVETVGQIMFAAYLVVVVILLVNILIAMMSHSFDSVQGFSDMEWKFARTILWMSYINHCSTLPVPFNMIPTTKTIRFMLGLFRDHISSDDGNDDDEFMNYDLAKRRGCILPSEKARLRAAAARARDSPTYAELLHRLVRRYLFKQDRSKAEGLQTVGFGEDSLKSPEVFGGPVLEEADEGVERGEDGDRIPRRKDTLMVTAPSLLSAQPSYEPTSPYYLSANDQNYYQQHRHSADSRAPGFTAGLRTPASPNEALRLLTRKATCRGSSIQRNKSLSRSSMTSRLDAVQRGQKLLEVRLQDLAGAGREEADNTRHIRQLFSENQKALDSIVKSMASTQEGMQNIATVVLSIYQHLQNQQPLQPQQQQQQQQATPQKTRRHSMKVKLLSSNQKEGKQKSQRQQHQLQPASALVATAALAAAPFAPVTAQQLQFQQEPLQAHNLQASLSLQHLYDEEQARNARETASPPRHLEQQQTVPPYKHPAPQKQLSVPDRQHLWQLHQEHPHY